MGNLLFILSDPDIPGGLVFGVSVCDWTDRLCDLGYCFQTVFCLCFLVIMFDFNLWNYRQLRKLLKRKCCEDCIQKIFLFSDCTIGECLTFWLFLNENLLPCEKFCGLKTIFRTLSLPFFVLLPLLCLFFPRFSLNSEIPSNFLMKVIQKLLNWYLLTRPSNI